MTTAPTARTTCSRPADPGQVVPGVVRGGRAARWGRGPSNRGRQLVAPRVNRRSVLHRRRSADPAELRPPGDAGRHHAAARGIEADCAGSLAPPPPSSSARSTTASRAGRSEQHGDQRALTGRSDWQVVDGGGPRGGVAVPGVAAAQEAAHRAGFLARSDGCGGRKTSLPHRKPPDRAASWPVATPRGPVTCGGQMRGRETPVSRLAAVHVTVDATLRGADGRLGTWPVLTWTQGHERSVLSDLRYFINCYRFSVL